MINLIVSNLNMPCLLYKDWTNNMHTFTYCNPKTQKIIDLFD